MMNGSKLNLYIAAAFIMSATLIHSAAKAEQRCSKYTGRCFEWPIIKDGTTLKKISTRGVWSKPDGAGPFPAVVIAETCGGSQPPVDKLWPAYFKSLEYVTYTPRILEEFGEDHCPSLRFVVNNDNRAKMLQVLYSALDDVAKKPYVQKNNIGIIGFSLGAILIRDAGEVKDLKSAGGLQFKYTIPVYGSCTLLERRGDNVPTLIIQAEKEKPKKRKLCLRVRNRDFPNVIYHEIAGAYHAFDDPKFSEIKIDVAGNKMKYNEEAVTKAKNLIENFIKSQN